MYTPSLIELGLRPFFQQQLSLEELESYSLGRVIEHHRSQVVLLSETGTVILPLLPNGDSICVGDWVLFTPERLYRTLERQSLFQRKAAGSKNTTQLIAANVDNVLIVSSLNDDFSLNRIERYLAIAKEAEVEPIVVLTKKDQAANSEELQQQVQDLDPFLLVHSLNSLDSQDIEQLKPYCKTGKTLAFMGSSGVGKSTLINALSDEEVMQTGEIREQDSKGRHTTTHREIKLLAEGGLLMDTPGMRELQLSGCEEGIKQTFSDIEDLAQQCRFKDCQHQQEPGCAVKKAVDSGDLDPRRLDNFNKLLREEAHNSATLAQKRAKDRAFSKMVNSVQDESRSAKKFR
jgi:ribosome biogenesis GTPase